MVCDDERRCTAQSKRQLGGRCQRAGYIYIGAGKWRCASHVDALAHDFDYAAVSAEQLARAERVREGI